MVDLLKIKNPQSNFNQKMDVVKQSIVVTEKVMG
jgi:hypothetical protein